MAAWMSVIPEIGGGGGGVGGDGGGGGGGGGDGRFVSCLKYLFVHYESTFYFF